MANLCLSDPKVKPKTQTSLKVLHQLHIYSILTAKVILSSILISVSLWLFVRMPEPEIHIKGLSVDALHQSLTQGRTLLNYNFTVHNPDLYKSVRYNVLVAYIFLAGDSFTSTGVTVNFNPERKEIHQGPGDKTVLSNHSFNYADPSVGWETKDLMTLKTADKSSISMVFVMEFRFLVFNQVVGTRQTTRIADIYFDDNGDAFINRRAGLKLHG